MFLTDLLCLSEGIKHAACLQTQFSELCAMSQALRMGSARGFRDLQRRCGRVLACDPPHPYVRLHAAMCTPGAHHARFCLQVQASCGCLGVGSDGLQLAVTEVARG